MTKFPHCDARVLHAPGECQYCDKHADWQELRELWRINFTGHHDGGKTVCPAELARPLEIINRWGGNVPAPEGQPAYGWLGGGEISSERDIPESPESADPGPIRTEPHYRGRRPDEKTPYRSAADPRGEAVPVRMGLVGTRDARGDRDVLSITFPITFPTTTIELDVKVLAKTVARELERERVRFGGL